MAVCPTWRTRRRRRNYSTSTVWRRVSGWASGTSDDWSRSAEFRIARSGATSVSIRPRSRRGSSSVVWTPNDHWSNVVVPDRHLGVAPWLTSNVVRLPRAGCGGMSGTATRRGRSARGASLARSTRSASPVRSRPTCCAATGSTRRARCARRRHQRREGCGVWCRGRRGACRVVRWCSWGVLSGRVGHRAGWSPTSPKVATRFPVELGGGAGLARMGRRITAPARRAATSRLVGGELVHPTGRRYGTLAQGSSRNSCRAGHHRSNARRCRARSSR